jgi:hypothetical protein
MDHDTELMKGIGIPQIIQEEIKKRARADGESVPDYIQYSLRIGMGREMHREQYGESPKTDRQALDTFTDTLGL